MKAYKTEIKPNKSQVQLIKQTLGNTRYVYNAYLAFNFENYKEGKDFVFGKDYSKMVNHDPNTPEWLKLVSSKALKQAIMQAERAFMDYFKGKSGKPKFKKKSKDKGFYLIGTIRVERHRIFLPTLKWVRLKEFGYIPKNVKSATVSMKNGRFYVSCLVDKEKDERIATSEQGIGIDFGLKDQFITKDKTYPSINKSSKIRKLERRLKREQRKLSRKYEANMTNKVYYKSGSKKGQLKSFEWIEPVRERRNIQRQHLKVNKIYERLATIRTAYNRACLQEILNQKPRFIAIEDLNIKGMMKNKHLAKAIAGAKWYESRQFLENQCQKLGIELRLVDRFYPSSKLCSNCGYKYTGLKLKEREWTCPSCHKKHDRDINASINLAQSPKYTVLTTV